MAIKVPVNFGRDLYEIRLSTVNGVETLTLGSSIYTKSA
jgi:hypothetical protein